MKKASLVVARGGTSNNQQVRALPAPNAVLAMPRVPTGMDAAARGHWQRLCRQLLEEGGLAVGDLGLVADLAHRSAHLDRLHAEAATAPMFVTIASGNLAEHPAHVAARAEARLVAVLAGALGIGPRARAEQSVKRRLYDKARAEVERVLENDVDSIGVVGGF